MLVLHEPGTEVTVPPEPTHQLHHGRARWTSRWVAPNGQQKVKRFGDVADVSRKQVMVLYADWLTVWKRGHQHALESGGRYTIRDLCADERDRARRRYLRNGKLTSSFDNIDLAMRDLEDVYGDRIADDVGAPQIADLRDRILVFKWVGGEKKIGDEKEPIRQSVRTVNYRLSCVQQAFKHARGRGKISAGTYADVASVPTIDPHDGVATPPKDIRPVPDLAVTATLAKCSPVLSDMIRVQRLSGMRPGELCLMRPCDIEPAHRDVWFYVPPEHKTAYTGKERVIALPPAAVKILRPYVENRPTMSLIFTPREHIASMTPDLKRGHKPLRAAGDAWNQTSYRRAVAWACKRADVEKWNPNQLRHRWATEVRRVLGIEAVKEGLSHASAKTSEIYAELSREKLTEMARKLA